MSEYKILVVEDDFNTLKVLGMILGKKGYRVFPAATAQEALDLYLAPSEPDIVLCDLRLPDMDGMELFKKMEAIRPAPPFVMMSAYGTVRSAVEALKFGVANYLIKPLDYDELLIVLQKAIRERELCRELDILKKDMGGEHTFHGMTGAGQTMRELFEMIRTVGPTDAPVMIYGETGTGKELVARALHLESTRRASAMVSVNCAALARDLLESELFGHVKGAFTGATNNKKGRLELAHQGTLLLDEIGHMSLELQTKLLRFAQEMTFEPVGGVEPVKVDVRLIGATNLDLKSEISEGRFLGDLLYRLEVIAIEVPPLRERKEDIPLLVERMLARYARQYKKNAPDIHGKAMEALVAHRWPGNVRELQNCLARAVILSKGNRLGIDDFPNLSEAGTGREPELEKGILGSIPRQGLSLKEVELELIKKTLDACQGNKSRASAMLGITRKGLYKKIKRFGLE